MYNSYDFKAIFMNQLIENLGYKKYLELGVLRGENFNIINCEYKLGVDSNKDILNYIENGVVKTTDDFFESLPSDEKYDIIFIDAYHEKHQVNMDFENSLKHLNKNGAVIFHDINPPIIEYTDISTKCGNVFEFWIEMVKTYNVFTFSSTTNMLEFGPDTIGLYFDKLNEKHKPLNLNSHDFEYFSENRTKYIDDINTNLVELISILR